VCARAAGLALAALAFSAAASAGTVLLGEEGCRPVDQADPLFRDGYEPSVGTGDTSIFVNVAGWPSSEVYLHVPPTYVPERPMPVLLALHGAAGSHAAAVDATALLRSQWAGLADQYGFIVIAPVGVGSQGSWFAPTSASDHPTDYDVFAAALDQVQASWNVDRSRIYGWGFSAGAHVMHDLAVRGFAPALDANHLAAYGVDAGALQALACGGLSSIVCGVERLAPMARRVPVAIEVGKSDPMLGYVRNDRTQFLGYGWASDVTFFYREFTGGHQYTVTELADVWTHICAFAVVP
jgi:poly(3-hydroxybutyrate) depolymerase